MARIRGDGTFQYKGKNKGKIPYHKGMGKSTGNVHAITYDGNEYEWAATGLDT